MILQCIIMNYFHAITGIIFSSDYVLGVFLGECHVKYLLGLKYIYVYASLV